MSNKNKSVEDWNDDMQHAYDSILFNHNPIEADKPFGEMLERVLTKLVQKTRQTSQEREREIVVNEVIEIIESVQLTATKKYADDTTPEKAKVVNEWLMPEVKRNIIEAVKTLTNPNKD